MLWMRRELWRGNARDGWLGLGGGLGTRTRYDDCVDDCSSYPVAIAFERSAQKLTRGGVVEKTRQ